MLRHAPKRSTDQDVVTQGSLWGGGEQCIDGFLKVGATPFVTFRADLEPGQLPLRIDDRRAQVVGDFVIAGLVKQSQGATNFGQFSVRGDCVRPQGRGRAANLSMLAQE